MSIFPSLLCFYEFSPLPVETSKRTETKGKAGVGTSQERLQIPLHSLRVTVETGCPRMPQGTSGILQAVPASLRDTHSLSPQLLSSTLYSFISHGFKIWSNPSHPKWNSKLPHLDAVPPPIRDPFGQWDFRVTSGLSLIFTLFQERYPVSNSRLPAHPLSSLSISDIVDYETHSVK